MSNKNNVNAFKRPFGVEFEIHGLKRSKIASVLKSINIQSYYGDRNDGKKWNIMDDGSIKSFTDVAVSNYLGHTDYNSQTSEVTSPILSGVRGLAAAKKVAKALREAGGFVSDSCGFHVHIDARDLSAEEIVVILMRYSNAEPLIDQWMPLERRGDDNTYCRSCKRSVANLQSNVLFPLALTHKETLAETTGRGGTRDVKLNLLSLTEYKTIEFRQHAGTLSSEAVENWVTFLQHFINESVEIAKTLPLTIPKLDSDTLFQAAILGAIINNTSYDNAGSLCGLTSNDILNTIYPLQTSQERLVASIDDLIKSGVKIQTKKNGIKDIQYCLPTSEINRLVKSKPQAAYEMLVEKIGAFGDKNQWIIEPLFENVTGISRQSNKALADFKDERLNINHALDGIPANVISYYMEKMNAESRIYLP